MKNFLLSTTAIVGVGLIASPVSAAEKIKLSISGGAETYIGFSDSEAEDVAGGGTPLRNIAQFGILTDKEIHFSGSTTMDNGIKIAIRIELEGDESATTIDESYINITSPTMGMVMLGGDDSVNAGAYVGPDRGISGDYDNWIAEVNATTNDNAYDSGAAGDDNKINYWSPRVGGFQVAGSYVPSTSSTGGTSPSAVNYDTGNHSAYALSLTWKETVGGVAVNSQVAMYKEGSVGGTTTQGQTNANVGLRLASQGWDVGYAYGRFMQPRNTENTAGDVTKDGHTHGAGVSYASGPWKVGVWHLRHENEGLMSNVNQDKTQVTSLFGQYQLSDGVLMQGMVFNADYDEESDVDANQQDGGWGVVTGIKLSF
jgi:outer membrane protein OmpU